MPAVNDNEALSSDNTPPQSDLPTWFPQPTKKKGKKKKQHVRPYHLYDDDDEEATPYIEPVTASTPPVSNGNGVKLDEPEPSQDLVDIAVDDEPWEDNTAIAEELLTPPAPSPKPAVAKPAAPLTISPPYRPATLHKPAPPYPTHRANSVATRRDSLARRPFDPPPPHLPQNHFYALPDLNLNLGLAPHKSETSKPAGSEGYCCRFDSFSSSGDAASARRAKDALLVGSEGGLEVYRVLHDKMEVCGRLEGLRGKVVDAKILPWTRVEGGGVGGLRPLVAVVVHGAVVDSGEGGMWQTSVEIYSLQTQGLVGTLYKSSTVKMEQPVVGHLSLPPRPVGDLSLDAEGRFIVLSSGKSGEVFVFTSDAQDGKTRSDTRPASSDGSPHDTDAPSRVPLMSLSARWLAIVPPYTSPGSSIQGSPLTSDSHPPPYGLGTHAAPSQPPLTCEVAGIDEEGTLSWLSRRAAQGLVTASQKGYEMGVAGWKELTHPAPPSMSSHQRSGSMEFPPTNAPAEDPRRLEREPAIVSTIDLKRLVDAHEAGVKGAPAALATWALGEGCNFLSFSPDGLRMLTSSGKGEVSSLWDLAHVAHGSMKVVEGLEGGPHVKLVQRIERSSPSVVVECAWGKEGEWVALLTGRGTVHLHEVPAMVAGRGKRKRRATFTVPLAVPAEKAEASVSLSHEVSPPSTGIFGGLRSWSRGVSSQVTAAKTAYAIPTTFAGFRESAKGVGAAGQRAVVRGVREGFSAAKGGLGDAWHAEDNKIRVKGMADGGGAKIGCVRWVQRQGEVGVCVVFGGKVDLWMVERVVRVRGGERVWGLKRERRVREFALPRISVGREGGCGKEGVHGFWSLRSAVSGDGRLGKVVNVNGGGGEVNEVETNPPYCPFHVDSRVNIYAFDDSGYASQVDVLGRGVNEDAMMGFKTRGHGVGEEAWLFGGVLPASTKLNERSQEDRHITHQVPANGLDDEEIVDGDVVQEDMVESRMTVQRGESEWGGQRHQQQEIRVESRRSRKGKKKGRGMGNEGGFDLMGDVDDDDALT
ncbi:hypothetical protein LTR97_005377 [Elasticomyces elasticus]|uniref:Uncharacterized protein n=1 Tax=Elasticomyces elasticus TaxID=574655 RepID=A0AAN8A2V5_9PEZI|nr:hypothetical protein LTR97_005377 [Elasticomyces elasticus]